MTDRLELVRLTSSPRRVDRKSLGIIQSLVSEKIRERSYAMSVSRVVLRTDKSYMITLLSYIILAMGIDIALQRFFPRINSFLCSFIATFLVFALWTYNYPDESRELVRWMVS